MCTAQQKVQRLLWFAELKSIVRVQIHFRQTYGRFDATDNESFIFLESLYFTIATLSIINCKQQPSIPIETEMLQYFSVTNSFCS